MRITDNIYFENGFTGANVSYVVTAEGIVMIDAPYKPTDAVGWKKEIESRGRVKYLVNTEGHGDHFAGNFFFPVPVIAHDKTREYIMPQSAQHIVEVLAVLDPQGLPLVKGYKINYPVITFSERLTFYLGKHSFHLFNFPGHTPGETAVLVPEERVIFTGDNVTGRTQGFFHDAVPYLWLESLKKIGELDFDKIVPGHGEVVEKSYLQEQADYVRECVDAIKKAINQGMTREEVVEKFRLPQRYSLQAGMEKRGPELLKMSVANLYDVLSRK